MKIIDLFDDNSRVKTLKYILSNPKEPYSKADIARATNLTWGSISLNLTPTIKKHLLIKVKEYSRGIYYKTNTKSMVYKTFNKEVN